MEPSAYAGLSFPQPQMIGCPILRARCEGRDKQSERGRASGAEQWYPTLRRQREGWGTRSFVVGEKQPMPARTSARSPGHRDSLLLAKFS